MPLFRRIKNQGSSTSDAPLSRGLLFGMMAVIGVLGLVIQTEMQIPPVVLAAVGALGGLVLLVFGIARPELPLYLFAAYIPFSKQLAGDFGGAAKALNLTNAFLAIILIGWFMGTSGKKPGFEPNKLHFPVLLIMFWGFVSLLAAFSVYGEWYFRHCLSDFKRWLDPIIIYFLFFHLVHDKQRWKNLVIIMMISVTMVAIMAIWEYQNIASSSSLETSRVYGIADNPNSLGAFFVYYMFIIAAFWLQKGQQARRWWLALAFLLCFRGIMVTFSRGAYLAFGCGFLALAFGRSKLLFSLVCGMMFFAVINPVLLPSGIRYRLLQSTFRDQHTDLVDAYGSGHVEQQVDKSAGMRIVIWEGAQKMTMDHPLFGVGLGLFKTFILQYAPILGKPYDAHNAYVLAAAEQGIPMLIFLIFLIFMSVWLAYRVYEGTKDPFVKSTALGWLAGLLGFAVANIFGSRINSAEVGGYFWILSALMARADVWTTEEQRQARAERRLSAREKLKAVFKGKSQAPTQQGAEKDAKYRKYAKYGGTRPS